VLAAAVSLRAQCRLSCYAEAEPAVVIKSEDLGQSVEAASVAALEYDGTCDLVKAAVRSLFLPGRIEVSTKAQAPPGSGLGSSAALGVAVVGALAAAGGETFPPEAVAERARNLELELGILCGKQDHYTASLGGFLLLRFKDPSVEVAPCNLSPDFVAELTRWCVLVDGGRQRLSGSIHEHVFGRYRCGERETIDALETIAGLANEAAAALRAESPAALAGVLSENWRAQCRLHPAVCDPATALLHDAAAGAGALGGKACGAGGGGCSFFIVEPGKRRAVEEALRAAGGKLLSFRFDPEGLSVS